MRFNMPTYTGNEDQYVVQAMRSNKMSGDGGFTRKCQAWFEENTPCQKALLTPSCTAALEMAAILIDVQVGDEIIMPSYTFVSTANAFVLRGARIIFVDIRPDTMNINEKLIERAITGKTKAIVPVHYAGVACEMDAIMDIALRHNLFVIEDAAQGMMASYKGRALGGIGHLAAYSFHETKNYTSGGEGGALLINDEKFIARAEIIREKGTNRSQFFRGQVDKYTWVDIGSSHLPSELQAAFLWGQLEYASKINSDRLATWNAYFQGLVGLQEKNLIKLPCLPKECQHNAHMFFIKTGSLKERTALIEYLAKRDIMSVFHYVPLHSAPAGERFGRLVGEDVFTNHESERLVRLPLYYGITPAEVDAVIASVQSFYA